tara:strand:+ start:809 stop:997 length:189 start_codon:yes stop_codon:yes gene_type:complete
MKKYRFEFDKFVKDLEKRADKNRQRINEEIHDLDEQRLKRLKAARYHEHPHNQIVYKQDTEK